MDAETSRPRLDESMIGAAATTLSNMQLEGVPIAEKVGKKTYRYHDYQGKEIKKDVALHLMGGLVWHVDLTDPSKGSLRCNGRFISLQDARAIVAGSKIGGNPANIRKLEEPIVLPRKHCACRLASMISFVLLIVVPNVSSGFLRCLESNFVLSVLDRVFCENLYTSYLGVWDFCALEGQADFHRGHCLSGGARLLPTPPALAGQTPADPQWQDAKLGSLAQYADVLDRDRRSALRVSYATDGASSIRPDNLFLILLGFHIVFSGLHIFGGTVLSLLWFLWVNSCGDMVWERVPRLTGGQEYMVDSIGGFTYDEWAAVLIRDSGGIDADVSCAAESLENAQLLPVLPVPACMFL